MLRIAADNSTKLTIAPTNVIIEGHSRVKPAEYFIPIAHTTSNSPANTNINQAMIGSPCENPGRPGYCSHAGGGRPPAAILTQPC
ncbi:conserved hypothetical protein [Massilia sp. 9I]|nr:conserved hypothetical protein [Massilia sp. 9I]